MRNIFNQKLFSYLVIGATLSACSMKDRTQAYQVNVQMPNSSSASAKFLSPSSVNKSVAIPNDIPTEALNAGFRCFALNIVGSGISADSRFACSDPSMGQMIGMASITGGSVSGDVLAGPSRTIQLIGAKFDATSTIQGCPSFESILSAAGDPTHKFDGVNVYLLGQTTTDVFSDVSVPIVADFNSTTQMFNNCGGNSATSTSGTAGTNSNSPQIGFDYFGPTVASAITTGSCVPLGLYLAKLPSGTTLTPPENFNLTWAFSSNVSDHLTFFTDPNCFTSLTSAGQTLVLGTGGAAEDWDNSGRIQLYVKVPTSIASNINISFSLNSLSAPWVTGALTLTTEAPNSSFTTTFGASVDASPFVNGGGASSADIVAGTSCHKVIINTPSSWVATSVANISVLSDSTNSPGAVLYNADCGSGASNPTSQFPADPVKSGGNMKYFSGVSLYPNGSNTYAFWVQDSVTETLTFDISDADPVVTVQPAQFSIIVLPTFASAETIMVATDATTSTSEEYTFIQTVDPVLSVQLKDSGGGQILASAGAMTCTAMGGSTPVASYKENGLYSVAFSPQSNGIISCFIGSQAITQLSFQVLSPIYTTISATNSTFSASGSAPQVTTVTITPMDTNNTPIYNYALVWELSVGNNLSCLGSSGPFEYNSAASAAGSYSASYTYINSSGCTGMQSGIPQIVHNNGSAAINFGPSSPVSFIFNP